MSQFTDCYITVGGGGGGAVTITKSLPRTPTDDTIDALKRRKKDLEDSLARVPSQRKELARVTALLKADEKTSAQKAGAK